MKRALIFLTLAATSASAESGLESLGYVAFALGLLSLLYSYNLTKGKTGLEAKIAREKVLLKKMRKEIQDHKEQLDAWKKQESVEVDGKVAHEIEKASTGVVHDRDDADGLRMEYWDRLGHMDSPTPEDPSVKKLVEEKKEIEGMIELTKMKYHTRELDEHSFSNITQEYQKRLIELEAKIKKQKGEENGD